MSDRPRSKFGHSSTVITTPVGFAEALEILTRFDWKTSSTQSVLLLGERKTSGLHVLVFTEKDDPPHALATAMEQIASSTDPARTSPVLAHQAFNIEIFDVSDHLWTAAHAVRLSRLSVVPASMSALATIGRNAMNSLRAKSTGFRGAIGMTHAGSSRVIFVEVFSSRAALRESEVTAYFDARIAREAGILRDPLEHEIYQTYPLTRQR